MTESPPDKPKRQNHARRDAVIMKAAKAAGAESVTLRDGTVVRFASDTVSNGAANEVERWFDQHARQA